MVSSLHYKLIVFLDIFVVSFPLKMLKGKFCRFESFISFTLWNFFQVFVFILSNVFLSFSFRLYKTIRRKNEFFVFSFVPDPFTEWVLHPDPVLRISIDKWVSRSSVVCFFSQRSGIRDNFKIFQLSTSHKNKKYPRSDR